ncbi:MAG: hypothetical protein ACFE0J_07900 [Elainellaceae cyanobacterium]
MSQMQLERRWDGAIARYAQSLLIECQTAIAPYLKTPCSLNS